ncbi:methanol dehydrogenase [Novimethylophilus kurashikiensis]|uniref:Methanol dehydrogenase n=1 Tax=Novimethylophilus kurashikiensis TaxID=1825523 RepID=A0A2R5FE89_9PROT|nr:hypothetical protein [Novimethylophilus kurashikiensis]GBG14794.1 methanol dehydrogenase [Novimethylophilus kurashikiensis]
MAKLIFRRKNDEVLEVCFDDKVISSCSHDSVGWDGMEEVESALKSLAAHLNIEVVDEYGDEEEVEELDEKED